MFLFKWLKKVPFICYQCSQEYLERLTHVEGIDSIALDGPDDPPYFDCPRCIGGVAFPINYTNKQGYTFLTRRKLKKNRGTYLEIFVQPPPLRKD